MLDGFYNGFRVIEPHATVPVYDCRNYKSCYVDDNKRKLYVLLSNELSAQKLSIAQNIPRCIHAMGVIEKSDGGIRPITDCRWPLKRSVNNYAEVVFSHFSYITIDDVVRFLRDVYVYRGH